LVFRPVVGITLDTGVLIAIEKGDERLRLELAEAVLSARKITLPCAVLAQFWRGNHPSAARTLRACTVEEMNEEIAKAVGHLLAESHTTDVIDASVVEGAARRGDVILTSDPVDIERLVEACGRKLRVVTV
jgi:predicted nucleic acid-binding protein